MKMSTLLLFLSMHCLTKPKIDVLQIDSSQDTLNSILKEAIEDFIQKRFVLIFSHGLLTQAVVSAITMSLFICLFS